MYQTHGQLNAWWRRKLGASVLLAEEKSLETLVTSTSTQTAVLLGCSAQLCLTTGHVYKRIFVVNPTISKFSTEDGIRGEWGDLPLKENSVDVLIVPHTLEWVGEEAPALFNEIYRVLKPEGELIIFGFNPSLLWKMWRYFYPKEDEIPWKQHLRPCGDLRFSLLALDYQLLKQKVFFHQLPNDQTFAVKTVNSILNAVKKIFPWFGGVYLLHLKKKIIGVTPVRLSWKKEKKLSVVKVAKPAPTARYRVEKE